MKRNGRFKDITGQVFGQLTVVAHSHNRGGWAYWTCLCACGNTFVTRGTFLRTGGSVSCGCARAHRVTHGMTGSPEYRSWAAIKVRCTDPGSKDFQGYGERGIFMCERWLHSFEHFYADMGPRPSLDYTIERIDNDGPYTPDNCRWATRQEQNYNKRNSHRVTFKDETRTVAEWAVLYNMNYFVLLGRLRAGWDIERALTEPKHR